VSLPAAGPNAAQITYWNEQSGPKWVALEARLDAQIAPLGRAAMERAAPRPGERVLDVGCGCGQTALELAERVGPSGEVVGADVSAVMLARARERAAEAGLAQVRFENVDAQVHELPGAYFDLLYSRFGVMFFADPVAAFANLRRSLRPGGRLAFVCWQALDRNPWMLVPAGAAAREIPMPDPPAPGEPGPFSLADEKRLRGILEDAGFEDLRLEPDTGELFVGGEGGLDEVVDFALGVGPAGAALREAGPEARPRVAAAVREALAPYAGERGVRMAYAAWIVRAEVP